MEAINHSKQLLDWGVGERAAIKSEMDRLDLRLKNVNNALIGVMEEINLKTYKHDLGSIIYKAGYETHSIDKEKLVAALLGAGLSADKVREIMAAADKPGKRSPSVSFLLNGEGAE